VTHPLAGRLVAARSFMRLNGELLVIELPDGSPGTIPAGATDVLGSAEAGGLPVVLDAGGWRRLRENSGSQSAVGTRGPRRGGREGLPAWSAAWTATATSCASRRRWRCSAEQYPADDAADVQGRVLRAVGHVKAPC